MSEDAVSAPASSGYVRLHLSALSNDHRKLAPLCCICRTLVPSLHLPALRYLAGDEDGSAKKSPWLMPAGVISDNMTPALIYRNSSR